MRFVVDECTGPAVARFLRDLGHDVFSVFEQARGIDDNAVIDLAVGGNRILITNDNDFGEKVHRTWYSKILAGMFHGMRVCHSRCSKLRRSSSHRSRERFEPPLSLGKLGFRQALDPQVGSVG